MENRMIKKEKVIEIANLLNFTINHYTLKKDPTCMHEEGLKEGAVEDITLLGKGNHFIISLLFNKDGNLVGYTGEGIDTYVSARDLKKDHFIKSLL